MNRRRLAIEWLVLLGCAVAGLTFTASLRRDDPTEYAATCALAYGVVQIGRVTWWAVTALVRRHDH